MKDFIKMFCKYLKHDWLAITVTIFVIGSWIKDGINSRGELIVYTLYCTIAAIDLYRHYTRLVDTERRYSK